MMKIKFKNFWYYYKVPLIIILVIAIVGLYFFLTQRGTVSSDYDIAIVSPRGVSAEQMEKLQNVLERGGTDQTGDGAVHADVHVYRFSIGEDGQDPKEIAGLDADLVGKLSGIFFVEDPDRFEESTNGIGKAADAVPVSDIPALSGCGLDDLYLLQRRDADEKYSDLRSNLTK